MTAAAGDSPLARPLGESAMTLLGKVLVFFVLLFSVITGGMMAMAYVTRTNWKTGYENAQNEVNVLIASQKAEREKFKALKEAFEKKIEDSNKEKETANTTIVGLRAEVENEKKKNADLDKRARTEQVNNDAATRQIDALSQERNQMKDQLSASNTRVLTLEKNIVTATNNETQATILAKRLDEQRESMMIQIER